MTAKVKTVKVDMTRDGALVVLEERDAMADKIDTAVQTALAEIDASGGTVRSITSILLGYTALYTIVYDVPVPPGAAPETVFLAS